MFENAYLCIFGFAYLCLFVHIYAYDIFVYIIYVHILFLHILAYELIMHIYCIFLFCLFLHIPAYLVLHIAAYFMHISAYLNLHIMANLPWSLYKHIKHTSPQEPGTQQGPDNSSARTSQGTVGGFTTCGLTLLGLSWIIFSQSLMS